VDKEFLDAKGVHGIVLRPPNVYGRSNGKALLALLTFAAQSLGAVPFAAGTADHKWTFVHVDASNAPERWCSGSKFRLSSDPTEPPSIVNDPSIS